MMEQALTMRAILLRHRKMPSWQILSSPARMWRQIYQIKHLRLASGLAAAAVAPQKLSEALKVEPRARSFAGYLPPPSAEQQVAIDTLLKTKNNLIVDAMAGSGKTTTILHLAQAAPDLNFLVLVYNRRLMIETQARVAALGMHNMTVLNYHSLGARFYTPECATDQGLKRVVEDDMNVLPGKTLPEFSVLVMDEQQDLTPILKRFVDKVLKDKGWIISDRQPSSTEQQLRVVCLGDKRQEIYSFNNADSRFLTLANSKHIFGYVNDNPWTEAQQTASNRVTEPNARFINEQLVRDDPGKPMQAVRQKRADGSTYPKPRYVIGKPIAAAVEEIKRLLYECNVPTSDIIVLGPSTRGKSPAKQVANQLALENIPVHRADSDVTDIPPEVLAGRILVCSYHQAKGIERPACIVVGFDSSYHTHYDKRSEAPATVSNAQYVAATRAVEHLVLIHDHEWAPLHFVDMDTLSRTADVIVNQEMPAILKVMNVAKDAKVKLTHGSVSSLCRNLSETLITKCLQNIEIRQILDPYIPSEAPPTKIKDKFDLFEGVSHITGTAVPALLQWFKDKQLTMLDSVKPEKRFWKKDFWRDLPEKYIDKVKDIQARVSAGAAVGVSDILYIASVVVAEMDKDAIKLVGIPIDGYNWISDEYAKELIFTLDTLPSPAHVTRTVKYEAPLHGAFPATELDPDGSGIATKTEKVHIMGVMDIFRPQKTKEHVIWEIKHMETLQPEHLLQVVLYMLLCKKQSRGYLVSARTGHTVQVLPRTPKSLTTILSLLVSAKYGGPQALLLNAYTDEAFLAEAAQDFDNIVGKCALPTWFTARPSRSRFEKRRKKDLES